MESENKPRILIVEDHPLIAELVETRLRIEGMHPIKCPGGREALVVLMQERLDAVICDIMMPDVDGYEVLRHIRSNPATKTLPVIFLTAKSTPADIEKGLALGANHYITKPFSGLDLVNKVRLCLEERQAGTASAARRHHRAQLPRQLHLLGRPAPPHAPPALTAPSGRADRLNLDSPRAPRARPSEASEEWGPVGLRPTGRGAEPLADLTAEDVD